VNFFDEIVRNGNFYMKKGWEVSQKVNFGRIAGGKNLS
jgi:hypothetical protein